MNDFIIPERYKVEFEDLSNPVQATTLEWAHKQQADLSEFGVRLLKELGAAEQAAKRTILTEADYTCCHCCLPLSKHRTVNVWCSPAGSTTSFLSQTSKTFDDLRAIRWGK